MPTHVQCTRDAHDCSRAAAGQAAHAPGTTSHNSQLPWCAVRNSSIVAADWRSAEHLHEAAGTHKLRTLCKQEASFAMR